MAAADAGTTPTDAAEGGIDWAEVARDKGLGCDMCREFLCQPIALMCGHTYCFACLFEHLAGGGGGPKTASSGRCPLCKATAPDLASFFDRANLRPIVNVALETTVKALVPASEYAARVVSLDSVVAFLDEELHSLFEGGDVPAKPPAGRAVWGSDTIEKSKYCGDRFVVDFPNTFKVVVEMLLKRNSALRSTTTWAPNALSCGGGFFYYEDIGAFRSVARLVLNNCVEEQRVTYATSMIMIEAARRLAEPVKLVDYVEGGEFAAVSKMCREAVEELQSNTDRLRSAQTQPAQRPPPAPAANTVQLPNPYSPSPETVLGGRQAGRGMARNERHATGRRAAQAIIDRVARNELVTTGTVSLPVQGGAVLMAEHPDRHFFWVRGIDTPLAPYTENINVSGDGDDTDDDMPALVEGRDEN